MTTSSDIREPDELPPSTRGPMVLILAALRGPANLALMRLNQLASAGSLNSQQVEYYNDVLRSLQQIARTVDQFAPPAERAARAVRPDERWDAGEHPDALDDRYQDTRLPLEDRPGRDGQP